VTITKVTSKGQVTIPVEIRKALNIEEGDALLFETAGRNSANIEVIKSKRLDEFRGSFARGKMIPDKARYRNTAKRDLAERSYKK